MTCTARVVAVTLSMVVLTTGGWLKTSHAQDPQGQVQPEEEKGQVQERAVPGLPGTRPGVQVFPGTPLTGPGPGAVMLSASSVTGGTPVQATVTLNAPVPQVGLVAVPAVLGLRSSNPAVASVPPSVAIPPGGKSATFVVQTQPTSNPASVDITAASLGAPPMIAQLTVVPPQLINPIMVFPGPVVGGFTVTWLVNLTGPAPSQGLVVTLVSQYPAIANVPPRIPILPGARQGSFNIATQPVSQLTDVVITASLGASSAVGTITVVPSQH